MATWDEIVEQINEVDFIPAGELGSSRDFPFKVAPANFDDEGLPYGAWCECQKCLHIGRSTYGFDFFKREDGALWCEDCQYRNTARA